MVVSDGEFILSEYNITVKEDTARYDIPVWGRGKVVEIRGTSDNPLSLTEVEVMGTGGHLYLQRLMIIRVVSFQCIF